ncbi:transposase domain-containing protein [Rhizobium leguminosarum]|nr:transposase domain-containing protein [Rhizobium leguminosarum]
MILLEDVAHARDRSTFDLKARGRRKGDHCFAHRAVDPQTYLTATLTAIVNSHKQSRIDEQLPWKEITDFDFDDRPLKMRWNWRHIARNMLRQITYTL